MTSHALLRLAVAAWLAVWSPAWCQCVLMGAAGGVEPGLDLCCDPPQTEAAHHDDEPECCVDEARETAAAPCCSVELVPSTPAHHAIPCPCGCCAVRSLAAPSREGRIALELSETGAPIDENFISDEAGTTTWLARAIEWAHSPPPPVALSPQTLFANRCLLLI